MTCRLRLIRARRQRSTAGGDDDEILRSGVETAGSGLIDPEEDGHGDAEGQEEAMAQRA
jgi:hypothetical protein